MKKKTKINGVEVHCAFDKIVTVAELKKKFHPENPNEHPPEQLEAFAKVLKKNGIRRAVTMSARSGLITRGHGLVLAAELAGINALPVDVQEYKNEAAEIRDMVADNRIPELSRRDEKKIFALAMKLDSPEGTGFTAEEIAALSGEGGTPTKPEVPFATWIDEANNYVVLVFRNEIDWLGAQTHFGIQSVAARRSTGKPWSVGIGRVIDGAEYLAKVTKK